MHSWDEDEDGNDDHVGLYHHVEDEDQDGSGDGDVGLLVVNLRQPSPQEHGSGLLTLREHPKRPKPSENVTAVDARAL